MAANTNPIFTLVPTIDVATLAAANTARDGSGTPTTLVSGTTDGKRIRQITFISAQATAAANTAMVCRIFLSVDNGSTWVLRGEVAFPVVTASNTAIGQVQTFTFPDGLILYGTTQKIGVTKSVHAGVQDQVHVIAEGGSYS